MLVSLKCAPACAGSFLIKTSPSLSQSQLEQYSVGRSSGRFAWFKGRAPLPSQRGVAGRSPKEGLAGFSTGSQRLSPKRFQGSSCRAEADSGGGRGQESASGKGMRDEERQWEGIGTEAPGWDLEDKPETYWFAIANAHALMVEGAPLEEVLRDGVERAERGGKPRNVWLVVEPAFLTEHPGLATLKAQLEGPTAAIVTTNAGWMLTVVKQLLPQAIIGKFKAPSPYVVNPLKSAVKAADAIIGGGGVWH